MDNNNLLWIWITRNISSEVMTVMNNPWGPNISQVLVNQQKILDVLTFCCYVLSARAQPMREFILQNPSAVRVCVNVFIYQKYTKKINSKLWLLAVQAEQEAVLSQAWMEQSAEENQTGW